MTLTHRILFGAALSLAVTAATVYADEHGASQKEVMEIAKLLEDGKDVPAAKLDALRKKYDELNEIMHIHKPVARKGQGVEKVFIDASKRGVMAKDSAAALKAAHINLAVAMITTKYAPTKPKGGKGAKDWNGFNDDMTKATKEFIAAVKANKAADIKKAASNVNNACNECHSTFRD